MNWISETGIRLFSVLCYIVLLNGICGWIAFGIWSVLKRIWEKNGQYEWIYVCLKIVIWLFILPVSWLLIWSTSKTYGSQIVYNWYPWVNTKIAVVLIGLFLIWLEGASKELCEYISEKRWIRQLERKGRVLSNEEQSRFGGRELATVYVCSGIYSPMVSGLRKKKLYLPTLTYDAATMETILAHEMTHLRHHDPFYKKACAVITILYWFCPLTQRLFDAYNCWSEEMCDIELCMGKKAKWTAKEYYSIIFAEIERWQASQIRIGSALFEEKNTLEWRVKAMKHYHAMKKKRKYLCGALACLFFLSCSLSAIAVSSSAKVGLESIYDATMTTFKEHIDKNEFTESKQMIQDSLCQMTEISRESACGATYTWTIAKDEHYQKNNMFLKNSDQVNMRVKITAGSGPVNMGIVRNDSKRYISVRKDESCTFSIIEKGIYGFYVENKGKEKVTLEYSYSF